MLLRKFYVISKMLKVKKTITRETSSSIHFIYNPYYYFPYHYPTFHTLSLIA